ncbi:hypothetical protein TI39_contig4274g00007 [Zymoseptoria brevis]|uniref:Invertebrate defensins family profile domain-containing protein n=1 Tax=Zymoseptoria brevis TaxID=1047168 RepID=A0A0F4G8F5_9PEZI|nr:hypothetical protein TI39_contig4274g00007 [Zymoseptoria brevis]
MKFLAMVTVLVGLVAPALVSAWGCGDCTGMCRGRYGPNASGWCDGDECHCNY